MQCLIFFRRKIMSATSSATVQPIEMQERLTAPRRPDSNTNNQVQRPPGGLAAYFGPPGWREDEEDWFYRTARDYEYWGEGKAQGALGKTAYVGIQILWDFLVDEIRSSFFLTLVDISSVDLITYSTE
eukprot:g67107.t1